MLEATAIGNLTSDPTTRTLNNGNTLCSFGLACRTSQRDDSGQPVTEFIQVAVFGRQGENAAKYLRKGSKACVTGGLYTRVYNAKDGTARTSVQLTASNLEFLSARPESEAPQQNTRAASTRTRQAAPVVEDKDELPF